jgi:hypothetical protein
MGRLNKMITLSVLIIVMKSICDSLVISRQELGQPIFLEGIFGLTHMNSNKGCSKCANVGSFYNTENFLEFLLHKSLISSLVGGQ